MPIPERSAGREKTSNVIQVGGSEVLDLNAPIREDRIIRLKTVLARTGLSRSEMAPTLRLPSFFSSTKNKGRHFELDGDKNLWSNVIHLTMR